MEPVGSVEPPALLQNSRMNPLVIEPWGDGPTERDGRPLLLLLELGKQGGAKGLYTQRSFLGQCLLDGGPRTLVGPQLVGFGSLGLGA